MLATIAIVIAVLMKDSAAEIAMRYIKEHGEVTRSELEKHLGLSAPPAVRLLKKLKDSGQIITIGNGKNTRYKA